MWRNVPFFPLDLIASLVNLKVLYLGGPGSILHHACARKWLMGWGRISCAAVSIISPTTET